MKEYGPCNSQVTEHVQDQRWNVNKTAKSKTTSQHQWKAMKLFLHRRRTNTDAPPNAGPVLTTPGQPRVWNKRKSIIAWAGGVLQLLASALARWNPWHPNFCLDGLSVIDDGHWHQSRWRRSTTTRTSWHTPCTYSWSLQSQWPRENRPRNHW